jgi:nucleotide-binding universal stress UspA family protein
MNATGTRTRISLKNILYATDFSPSAAAALPYVKGLAKQYGAKVHAVHVRFPANYPIVTPEALPQMMAVAEEQSKAQEQQLEEMFADFAHDVTISDGSPWPTNGTAISVALIDAAVQQKIDLIVLGTHGRTGVGRALLGSVAEEIFRTAPCPVLTVGPHISQDTERRLKMKEVLYATDFSPESLAALPFAMSLAQEHAARLTLLHVVKAPEPGDLVHAEQYAESIRRQLTALIPGEAGLWCEPNVQVEQGNPAEKILETAIALGADLIVLGVRSAGGHMGATTHLLRHTAHRIVTQAQCPVFTVRG